jgi:hypothetical protein
MNGHAHRMQKRRRRLRLVSKFFRIKLKKLPMDRCRNLIFCLSKAVNSPRFNTPITKTGTSAQCLMTANQTKTPVFPRDENRILIK